LIVCSVLLPVVRAHDVITTKITWSREIARLVYNRCASCHRDGGTAFSLTTYEAARPWAKAIKEEVNERRMPPWGAVKGFGDFRDDQGLTQEQIELINDWVEGGAPEGDPARMPSLPDFSIKPALPAIGSEVIVDGRLTLTKRITVEGIRPSNVPEGTTLQVIAERPDGSIEPMLWLYNYKPKFQHPYFYKHALSFDAGTKIEVVPASAGALALLTSAPAPPLSGATGGAAR
jgi:hypothetical protein